MGSEMCIRDSYYLMRQYDEGIKKLKVYLEAEPKDNYLLWALAYLQAGKGDYKAAIQSLHQRSIGTTTNWVLGYCYAKTGNLKDAKMILNNNIEKSKKEAIPDFMMAVQYCALGYKAQALDHLAKSIHTGGEGFFVLGIADDPMLEPLRSDPEFQRIVKEVRRLYNLTD